MKNKDIHIWVISKLDISEEDKQNAITYLKYYGSDADFDIILKLSNCGFGWSDSPQGGDFWINLSSKYSEFVSQYDSLFEMIPEIDRLALETNNNVVPGYEETNFDRLLYIIKKLPIKRPLQRLCRKDLLYLKRNGKIPSSKIKSLSSVTRYEMQRIVHRLFTWSESSRDNLIGWSNIAYMVDSYISEHPNVIRELTQHNKQILITPRNVVNSNVIISTERATDDFPF